MTSRDVNLKEKLKQALTSTAKVISNDFKIKSAKDNTKNSKIIEGRDIDQLNSKNDFIKARAESDSSALKKKFSNDQIYKKNLPSSNSCRSLYSIAEKIRYESLGCKMLKGIKKNLKQNYDQIINSKKMENIKTKEDIPVTEAFELYMLKKFHGVKLNSLTSDMLSFWEKDFDQAINKHMKYLEENLDHQNEYSSKFSKILQEMEIFQNEDNEETNEENFEDEQNNTSNDDQDSNNDDQKDKNKEEDTQASLDTDYDVDEYKLDEQMAETDTDQQSNEQVIQKKKYSRYKFKL